MTRNSIFSTFLSNAMGWPISRESVKKTVKSLWADDMMEFPAELRSIVAIADSKRVANQLNEELFERQIALADLILLNKAVD